MKPDLGHASVGSIPFALSFFGRVQQNAFAGMTGEGIFYFRMEETVT